MPSGRSPREEKERERKREEGREMAELAEMARLVSGESARGDEVEDGAGKRRARDEGRGRLSPGVRMPGSPGFGEAEMREWEKRGLDMLE